MVGYSIKKTPRVSDTDPKVNSMKKYFVLLLALISLSVKALPEWNPYSMDREQFVHLSEEDKKVIIIRTMEFMVELESKYKKDVEVAGFSPDRYDKYVKALEKLQNIFFANAYAQGASGVQEEPLRALASKFGKLLGSLKDKGCVYGGYISKMNKTASGDSYCQHPSTISDKDKDAKAIKAAYLSIAGSCKGPDKISCNPVVFGYANGKTPFCVNTGNLKSQKAHNVSYACMTKALDGDEKSVSDRLAVVSAAMTNAEDDVIKQVHNFIFDTCACDGKTSINQAYAAYVKPHRTCYGMMNTLRVMKTDKCSTLDNVGNSQFANEWAQYFGKKVSFPELKPEKSGDFDKAYASLINKDQVKAICNNKDEPEKPEWSCTGACTQVEAASDGKKKWSCVITGTWKVTKGTEVLEEAKVSETKEFDDESNKTYLVKLKPDLERECKLEYQTAQTPAEAVACTITVAASGDDKTKAEATIAVTGLKDSAKYEVTWTDAVKDAKDQMKAIVTKTDKDGKVSASVKVTGAGASSSTATGAGAGATPATGTGAGATVATGTGAAAGAAGDIKCEQTVPKIDAGGDDGKDYTIEAKSEDPTDPKATTIKVVATVKKKGVALEALGDLVVKWTYVGFKSEEAPKKKEKKTGKAGDGDGTPTTGTPTNGAPDGGAAIPKIDETKGTGLTHDASRVKEEYQACATLYDKADKKLAGPACDKVSPLTEVKPPQNNPVQFPPGSQPQMPQFMAPQNNTSVQGIR